jgi:hypothetical protein
MTGPYATPQPVLPFQGDQTYKMPPPPAFMLQNLMRGQYQNRMNVPMNAHSISADQVRRVTYGVRACGVWHTEYELAACDNQKTYGVFESGAQSSQMILTR